MNIKLEKSDLYLVLVYHAFGIPLSMVDYADYPSWTVLFSEVAIFIIGDLIVAYLIVFILMPKYFFKKKLFWFFLITIILLIISGNICTNLYCSVATCKGDPLSLDFIYFGFVNQTESVGILAMILLGKKLYDYQLYTAEVEKEKKEGELRFLKSQIDPHFLFNNLNTVDSLIDTNPQGAKVYLNKLSTLYRYLISSKDQEVVPLEDELEFAQNYIYLIESRFGNAYQFEISDSRNDENSVMVPPGALQTLLENIVKHNQASAEIPVKSELIINDSGITVSNNRRPKTHKIDSTGTGLKNLSARYKLLTDKILEIKEDDNRFSVHLPLIKLLT